MIEVYDITYTAVGGKVTSMNKTLSNATTTGITIMPLVETLGFSRNLHDSAMHRASQATSMQTWLTTYELEISKSFTVPLAVHTVPLDSIRAQERISKVIAQVPVASLWLLVLANMSFAVLAIIVASFALKAAQGRDVHQVYLLLSISGLVAALFEPNVKDKVVESESALFQENDKMETVRTAVSIRQTSTGGVSWMTHMSGRRTMSNYSQTSGIIAPDDINFGRSEHTQHESTTRRTTSIARGQSLTLTERNEINEPLLEERR